MYDAKKRSCTAKLAGQFKLTNFPTQQPYCSFIKSIIPIKRDGRFHLNFYFDLSISELKIKSLFGLVSVH